MRIWSTLLIAAPVAAGLLAAPAANADWRDQRGWHGDRGWHGGGYQGGYHHDHDDGGAAAAAVLGLGAAAIIGGVIASQQPRYYAPPPPVVYAPPPPYYSGYSQVLTESRRGRMIHHRFSLCVISAQAGTEAQPHVA